MRKGLRPLFLFHYICGNFIAMKKYFLFRREEVNVSSVTASDSGVGLSLLAVPADNIAYISSELGRVKIVFNDVTMYQEANLRDGESIEKSFVYISCEQGKEFDLVESILKFSSSEDSVSSIMTLDIVSGKSTLPQASLDELDLRVKRRPVNMQTGEVSTKADRDNESASLLAGIDFGVHQPLVDYNHSGLSTLSHDAEIELWQNSGSGGPAYNITSNVGTPRCHSPASEQFGLTTKSAAFVSGDYFVVPEVNVDNDYTIYLVWDTQYADSLYNPYLFTMYGDADGETLGPGGRFRTAGPATSLTPSSDIISVRHDGVTTIPASTRTNTFVPQQVGSPDFSSVNVLIIRRDKSNNIFAHDKSGKIVATIQDDKSRTTKGRLKIERLGTTGSITEGNFGKGSIARFGVISHDVGVDSASKLATDFFNYYKF